MNTISSAHQSKLSQALHQNREVLRASSMGTTDMIDCFVRLAGSPKDAHVIVNEFEKKMNQGYELDSVLRDIYRKALNTVSRNRRSSMH